MKIAVLISGQMRDSFNTYLNHYKQFIEPNNADVFVATSTKNFWYEWEGDWDPKKVFVHLHSEIDEKDIIERIKSYYGNNLKGYAISNKEAIPERKDPIKYFEYFMNNQFNNNKYAFQLALDYEKENNINYDMFVRLRIDKTVFPKPLILTNDILLPICTHIEPTTFFFIGNREMMKYYCTWTYSSIYSSPPKEILEHIRKKYDINIIEKSLTIYIQRDGLGTICDFPYSLNNKSEVGYNAYRKEPKQFKI